MSDGRIIIDTEISDEGLDKGLNSVDKKLKGLGKTGKKTSLDLKKLASGASAAAAAFAAGVKEVNRLTEVYRTQVQAEKQLEQAARNNPFLNTAAVESLKSYASQLQAVTTFGDEELLGFIAQLSAAGRTQSEIEKIMAASVDIAASGAMSLDGAVRNLNKTFGGLSGELGETIPEIKALTEEELKNGAAVDLMAARYKGMAAEVTAAAGGAKQLANLKGDFLEAVGTLTAPTTELWEKFWTKVYTDGIAAIKKLNKDLEMFGINTGMNKRFAENIQVLLDPKNVAAQSDEFIDYILGQLDAKKELSKEEFKALSNLIDEKEARREIAKQQQEQAKQSAKQAKYDESRKKRAEYIKAITTAREKEIEKIELQAKAEGKEVDQYEILQAYASSYVSLVAESNGLVKEGDKEAVALLATVQQLGYEYENITANQERQKELEEERREEAKKLREELQGALDEITADQSTADRMQSQLDALDEMYKATADTEARTFELEQEYAEKRKILAKQVADARVAEQRQETIALLEIVNQFATQYNSIMSAIQTLATDYIENDAKVKTAAVEEQYAAGELSAEQYQERLTEINKKAAQEKYKADMWAWSANLAMGIANTALGATKALAEGGPISGPLLAALMIAAGGVQLASLISAKPIPPSFATGGIVPGTSYTGDKVTALVNSGEMILNAGQQRALFDSINSGNIGGGTKVQVYNQASNEVKAEPQVTEDGIRIMIRKTVAKDMADGRFNRSYRTMQNGLKGTRLTN